MTDRPGQVGRAPRGARAARAVAAAGLLTPLLVASACGSTGTGSPADDRLTVFAAASLTEAFRGMGEAFEAARPGSEVTFNFAGSQLLATQIRETAAADVYASADPPQMRRVRRAGRVGEPLVFATNRMVITVPARNPADIDEPSDLARQGTTVVLAGPAVPAGRYARKALAHLGLLRRVEPNVVSNEEDVRQALGKVVSATADAAIVYRSDVTTEVASQVAVVELDVPVQARYLVAATTTSDQPELARAFVDYVRRHGRPFLRQAGFGVPSAPRSSLPSP